MSWRVFVMATPDANRVEVNASETQARSWKATGARMVTPSERRRLVFPVDLDEGVEIDATDEQRYEHLERTWINAYAELQRVRPDVRPEDAVLAELTRLRAENERMRAVVDAALVWRKLPGPSSGGPLTRAVDAYRDSRGHAFAPPNGDNACKVCGATPNDSGERVHGRGCRAIDADGGGSDWPG